MSKRITITIETGNAAFEDSPGAETSRLLRLIADRIERDGDCCVTVNDEQTLFDLNGNRVGTLKVACGRRTR